MYTYSIYELLPVLKKIMVTESHPWGSVFITIFKYKDSKNLKFVCVIKTNWKHGFRPIQKL
jgi:hypothetical protein